MTDRDLRRWKRRKVSSIEGRGEYVFSRVRGRSRRRRGVVQNGETASDRVAAGSGRLID